VPLLIIDDIGLKPMCTPEDEDFHDLIAEQYERTSTVLSNLDFTEWDDAFATNKMLGAATLDGLCEALTMSLNSTAAHPGERTSIPLLQAVGQNSAQINNQHVNGRYR
jgi:IstB-like ATP binding protein